MAENSDCILCGSDKVAFFHDDGSREYFRCEECKLIFVPEKYLLPPEEEKRRYDLHENDSSDPDYRDFLNRMFEPMNKLLEKDSNGLDFGSGPGPTLSVMFEEAGHSVDLFDPFYAENTSVFKNRYDFITATEVVEHLHDPGKELQRLWDCLKKEGFLGIMTKRPKDKSHFVNWHYTRDETHVAFFSWDTFIWLADKWGAEVEFIGKDVVIFQK